MSSAPSVSAVCSTQVMGGSIFVVCCRLDSADPTGRVREQNGGKLISAASPTDGTLDIDVEMLSGSIGKTALARLCVVSLYDAAALGESGADLDPDSVSPECWREVTEKACVRRAADGISTDARG